MRQDEGVDAFQDRTGDVFSLNVGAHVSVDHGLEELALDEDGLGFLVGAVHHPLLGQHEFLSGEFQAQLDPVDDDAVGGLDDLFEVVDGLQGVDFSQDLDVGAHGPHEVPHMLNVLLPNDEGHRNKVKAAFEGVVDQVELVLGAQDGEGLVLAAWDLDGPVAPQDPSTLHFHCHPFMRAFSYQADYLPIINVDNVIWLHCPRQLLVVTVDHLGVGLLEVVLAVDEQLLARSQDEALRVHSLRGPDLPTPQLQHQRASLMGPQSLCLNELPKQPLVGLDGAVGHVESGHGHASIEELDDLFYFSGGRS
mmetsp:Transcript_6376/g.5683  ORF Transcript_6376/g.5683 Transcript_6376/m.5683 type:complete len:307 (-) Transcript_6376:164-1084(-)